MPSQDKKLAILDSLKRNPGPISSEELLKLLDKKTYSERSLRRYLNELVAEGLIEKIGKGPSTKYQIISVPSQNQWKFGSNAQKIIAQIKRPLYERVPVAYNDDWIDSYHPNSSFYLPEELREEFKRIGQRTQKEEPAGTYAHQIYNRLLIDLSYNSSRLEGNTYSLLDTQKLVLEGASAKDKLDEEKTMILNHKEAIRYIVDNASKLKVNPETICSIHYLLSDGLIENQYVGKVRDHGVRIGGSTYIPFENPKDLRSRLNLICKKGAQIEDPFEQSFFLLVHITYLQAFIDVNKRTARLSANIPLIKNNVVPQSFNDVDKDDYTSAVIAIYELQNPRPLSELYKFSYQRTCAMYDSTVKAIGFDEIRVRYRSQRRALIRDIILRKLNGKKMEVAISNEAKKVAKEDRKSFIEDTLEDLEHIDVNRIAGLGITPEDLKAWKK